ncbi:hypothetical protein BDP27DRAFT_1344452 [Rhodocollybia butyracea]|uniref:Uncharacterized protein n=1 Tax=Rhodocollybia butyracea TaxID=206335 RepID=A0A9P5TXF7_9AGAR|nr:hypothetical protein BDP27DRAFT_1344452 [Rhodocollybia butyracea]
MPTIQRAKPTLQMYRGPSTRRSPIQTPMQLKAETLPQYYSDLSGYPSASEISTRDKLLSFLQSIQKVAARLLTDPEFTRAKAFRFLAPIAVFLFLLIVFATFHQNWDIWITDKAMMNQVAEVGFLCMMVVVLIGGTLGVLWLLIWVVHFSVKRFTESNFTGGRTSMLGNVMGGLFTS